MAENDGEGLAAPVSDVVESLDEIFATNDVVYDTIVAWGKKVRVVSLSANDFIEWQEANDGPAKKTAGIRLFVKSVVNANGDHIGKPEHTEKLKHKSFKEILTVVNKILAMNGLQKEKADEAKND